MNRHNDLLFAFLIGAVAGGVTALLLAPEKGSEMRRKIRKGMDDLYEKEIGRLDAVRDHFRKTTNEEMAAVKLD